MLGSPEGLADAEGIDDQVVHGVLSGESGTHHEHWQDLSPAVARGALVKAAELRRKHADPGDAYLEGLSDKDAIEGALGQIHDLEDILAREFPDPGTEQQQLWAS